MLRDSGTNSYLKVIYGGQAFLWISKQSVQNVLILLLCHTLATSVTSRDYKLQNLDLFDYYIYYIHSKTRYIKHTEKNDIWKCPSMNKLAHAHRYLLAQGG
jgi:hypothetical protein